jgi:hypothetical protein
MRLLCVASALGCGVLHGCGAIAGQTARTATEGAAEGTLDQLEDERTRRVLAEFVRSPEVRAATHEFSAQLARGALAGLTEEQQAERFAEYLALLTARSTGAALDAALADDSRRQIQALSAAVARATGRAMAASLREDLGPALRGVLADDIGPGLSALLSEELNQAVSRTAHEVARGALLGAQEAAPLPPAPTIALLGLNLDLFGIMLVFAVLLSLLAIGLLVWALRLRKRLRIGAVEAERTEASTILLARAIKATEGKPWAPELHATLRETVRDDEAAEALRRVLRKHKELRLAASDIERGTSH